MSPVTHVMKEMRNVPILHPVTIRKKLPNFYFSPNLFNVLNGF